jgi:hypothetical protein
VTLLGFELSALPVPHMSLIFFKSITKKKKKKKQGHLRSSSTVKAKGKARFAAKDYKLEDGSFEIFDFRYNLILFDLDRKVNKKNPEL